MTVARPCRSSIEGFTCNNVLSVLTDTNAVVLTTNKAFEANLRASILGKNCNCLQKLGDPRNSISNTAIRTALKNRRPLVTHLLNVNSDGHEYLVVISIRPIFDSSGSIHGFYSLQLPMLHVTPYKGSLPILIPPSERHPYRRFYETQYTEEEASLVHEIDILFPDIIGKKRESINNKKEITFLQKRLVADTKAKTREKMAMDVFEGYKKYVEDGISSDEDSSDSELDLLVKLPDELPNVSHPLVYRLQSLTSDERVHHLGELREVATSEFFEAISDSDADRVSFLLDTLAATCPPLLDVNVFTEHGLTACHIAAHKGDLNMLKLLVARGANLLTHKWHYTVWAHALNSVSKGLGCTQQVLDWLHINGAENLAIMGNASLVSKYTKAYRAAAKKSRRKNRNSI